MPLGKPTGPQTGLPATPNLLTKMIISCLVFIVQLWFDHIYSLTRTLNVSVRPSAGVRTSGGGHAELATPNLLTKIIPTKIAYQHFLTSKNPFQPHLVCFDHQWRHPPKRASGVSTPNTPTNVIHTKTD